MRGEFAPEMACGPVELRLVAREERILIGLFLVGRRVETRGRAGVREDFHHVMALREAEALQCAFQRRRSRAAEAGADNFERHDFWLKSFVAVCCAMSAI